VELLYSRATIINGLYVIYRLPSCGVLLTPDFLKPLYETSCRTVARLVRIGRYCNSKIIIDVPHQQTGVSIPHLNNGLHLF